MVKVKAYQHPTCATAVRRQRPRVDQDGDNDDPPRTSNLAPFAQVSNRRRRRTQLVRYEEIKIEYEPNERLNDGISGKYVILDQAFDHPIGDIDLLYHEVDMTEFTDDYVLREMGEEERHNEDAFRRRVLEVEQLNRDEWYLRGSGYKKVLRLAFYKVLKEYIRPRLPNNIEVIIHAMYENGQEDTVLTYFETWGFQRVINTEYRYADLYPMLGYLNEMLRILSLLYESNSGSSLSSIQQQNQSSSQESTEAQQPVSIVSNVVNHEEESNTFVSSYILEVRDHSVDVKDMTEEEKVSLVDRFNGEDWIHRAPKPEWDFDRYFFTKKLIMESTNLTLFDIIETIDGSMKNRSEDDRIHIIEVLRDLTIIIQVFGEYEGSRVLRVEPQHGYSRSVRIAFTCPNRATYNSVYRLCHYIKDHQQDWEMEDIQSVWDGPRFQTNFTQSDTNAWDDEDGDGDGDETTYLYPDQLPSSDEEEDDSIDYKRQDERYHQLKDDVSIALSDIILESGGIDLDRDGSGSDPKPKKTSLWSRVWNAVDPRIPATYFDRPTFVYELGELVEEKRMSTKVACGCNTQPSHFIEQGKDHFVTYLPCGHYTHIHCAIRCIQSGKPYCRLHEDANKGVLRTSTQHTLQSTSKTVEISHCFIHITKNKKRVYIQPRRRRNGTEGGPDDQPISRQGIIKRRRSQRSDGWIDRFQRMRFTPSQHNNPLELLELSIDGGHRGLLASFSDVPSYIHGIQANRDLHQQRVNRRALMIRRLKETNTGVDCFMTETFKDFVDTSDMPVDEVKELIESYTSNGWKIEGDDWYGYHCEKEHIRESKGLTLFEMDNLILSLVMHSDEGDAFTTFEYNYGLDVEMSAFGVYQGGYRIIADLHDESGYSAEAVLRFTCPNRDIRDKVMRICQLLEDDPWVDIKDVLLIWNGNYESPDEMDEKSDESPSSQPSTSAGSYGKYHRRHRKDIGPVRPSIRGNRSRKSKQSKEKPKKGSSKHPDRVESKNQKNEQILSMVKRELDLYKKENSILGKQSVEMEARYKRLEAMWNRFIQKYNMDHQSIQKLQNDVKQQEKVYQQHIHDLADVFDMMKITVKSSRDVRDLARMMREIRTHQGRDGELDPLSSSSSSSSSSDEDEKFQVQYSQPNADANGSDINMVSLTMNRSITGRSDNEAILRRYVNDVYSRFTSRYQFTVQFKEHFRTPDFDEHGTNEIRTGLGSRSHIQNGNQWFTRHILRNNDIVYFNNYQSITEMSSFLDSILLLFTVDDLVSYPSVLWVRDAIVIPSAYPRSKGILLPNLESHPTTSACISIHGTNNHFFRFMVRLLEIIKLYIANHDYTSKSDVYSIFLRFVYTSTAPGLLKMRREEDDSNDDDESDSTFKRIRSDDRDNDEKDVLNRSQQTTEAGLMDVPTDVMQHVMIPMMGHSTATTFSRASQSLRRFHVYKAVFIENIQRDPQKYVGSSIRYLYGVSSLSQLYSAEEKQYIPGNVECMALANDFTNDQSISTLPHGLKHIEVSSDCLPMFFTRSYPSNSFLKSLYVTESMDKPITYSIVHPFQAIQMKYSVNIPRGFFPNSIKGLDLTVGRYSTPRIGDSLPEGLRYLHINTFEIPGVDFQLPSTLEQLELNLTSDKSPFAASVTLNLNEGLKSFSITARGWIQFKGSFPTTLKHLRVTSLYASHLPITRLFSNEIIKHSSLEHLEVLFLQADQLPRVYEYKLPSTLKSFRLECSPSNSVTLYPIDWLPQSLELLNLSLPTVRRKGRLSPILPGHIPRSLKYLQIEGFNTIVDTSTIFSSTLTHLVIKSCTMTFTNIQPSIKYLFYDKFSDTGSLSHTEVFPNLVVHTSSIDELVGYIQQQKVDWKEMELIRTYIVHSHPFESKRDYGFYQMSTDGNGENELDITSADYKKKSQSMTASGGPDRTVRKSNSLRQSNTTPYSRTTENIQDEMTSNHAKIPGEHPWVMQYREQSGSTLTITIAKKPYEIILMDRLHPNLIEVDVKITDRYTEYQFNVLPEARKGFVHCVSFNVINNTKFITVHEYKVYIQIVDPKKKEVLSLDVFQVDASERLYDLDDEESTDEVDEYALSFIDSDFPPASSSSANYVYSSSSANYQPESFNSVTTRSIPGVSNIPSSSSSSSSANYIPEPISSVAPRSDNSISKPSSLGTKNNESKKS